MKYKCHFFVSYNKKMMIFFLILLINNSVIAKNDSNLKDVFSSSQDKVQVYDSSSSKVKVSSDTINIYDNASKLIKENDKQLLKDTISVKSNDQQMISSPILENSNNTENKDIKLSNNIYFENKLLKQKFIDQVDNNKYDIGSIDLENGLIRVQNSVNQLNLNQKEIINLEGNYQSSNDSLRNFKVKNEFNHSMIELNAFKINKDSDIQLTHDVVVNQVKSLKNNTSKLMEKLNKQKTKLNENINSIKFFDKKEELTDNTKQTKLNNSSNISNNFENKLSISEFDLSNKNGKNSFDENIKLEVKEYTNNLNLPNLFVEKALNIVKEKTRHANDIEEKKKMLTLEQKLNKIMNNNTRTLEKLKKEYEKLSKYHIKLLENEEDKLNIDSKIQNQTLLNNKLLGTLKFLKEQNNNELKSITAIKNSISNVKEISRDLNVETHLMDSKILEVDYDLKSLDLEKKILN